MLATGLWRYSAFSRVKGASYIFGTTVLCVVAGVSVTMYPIRSTAGATALVGLVFLSIRWPILSVAALAITTTTVFEPGALPELHGVKLSEIALAVVTAVAYAVRRPYRATRWERIVGRCLGAYLLVDLGGVAIGLSHGSSLPDAIHGFRPTVYLAAYWPLAWLIRSGRVRRQLLWLTIVLAVGVAAVQLAQSWLGLFGARLFIASANNSVVMDQGGFARVRTPGITLVYIVCIFSLAYVIWGNGSRRSLAGILACVCLAAIAVSLNRNMLLGLGSAVAVAAIVLPRRRNVVSFGAATAIGIVCALAFLPATAKTGAVGEILSRFGSVANPAITQSKSIQDRQYENRLALAKVREHPLTGLGWGPSYGARIILSEDGVPVSQDRPFVQFQYLALWLRTGLLGVLLFVAALLTAAIAAVKSARAGEPRWFAAGGLMSVTALSVGAAVATYFTTASPLIVVAAVLASSAVPGEATEAREAYANPYKTAS